MDAEDWDRRYAQTELLWSAEPNRFVAAELAALAPGRALDLAAGEGRNALWLAQRGFDVTAVDFSRVALDRGRQLAARRGLSLCFEQADLDAYVPEARAYDLVLIAYLQLPWPRMQPILHRACEAVAPGGTLLVIGHDRENLERGHGGPSDPGVLYRAPDVAKELAGLVIERAECVERPVETDSGTAIALDTLVRARREH